jgi:hypothetical protein
MKKKMLFAKFEELTESSGGILLGGFLSISPIMNGQNNCTSTNKDCTEGPHANNCSGSNCMLACGA